MILKGQFSLASGELLEAEFLDRRNRFLVSCRVAGGTRIEAFLPNPGRLQELLLPGVRLWLRDKPADSALPLSTPLRHAAVAVEREGHLICLDTHITARVAGYLIERGLVPQLRRSRVLGFEIASGRSRFDMLVERNGEQIITEVKSVTLYGNGVAMFPDAVTERGRRHLAELAEHARQGRPAAVIFIVHSPEVRWFMPDYHTDFAFAQSMLAARHDVEIIPISVTWRADFSLADEVNVLDVPWEYLQHEVRDRGAYLLVLRLDRSRAFEAGALGSVTLRPGFYVYVGSAMQNLTARLSRHLRHRKKRHWHVDYLREAADSVRAYPIRTSHRIEEDLAVALSSILAPGPAGFGASDSMQPTHLFYSEANPAFDRRFHDVLQKFRMRPPT